MSVNAYLTNLKNGRHLRKLTTYILTDLQGKSVFMSINTEKGAEQFEAYFC